MPFKANAARRHHIPKQKRKVTNWAAYDASLRQRGRLTAWFTDEAITAWQAAPESTRKCGAATASVDNRQAMRPGVSSLGCGAPHRS